MSQQIFLSVCDEIAVAIYFHSVFTQIDTSVVYELIIMYETKDGIDLTHCPSIKLLLSLIYIMVVTVGCSFKIDTLGL